jgi:hypothetical protein
VNFSFVFYRLRCLLTDVGFHPSKQFIAASIDHLFRTTYECTDDMTVSWLLAYLNAAMPPDKHEDFDTSEVTKAAVALHERGRIIFEGDVLRRMGE